MSERIEFKAYHAPRGHRDKLIEPLLGEAGALIDENQTRAASYPNELKSLRRPAREQFLRDARRYTLAYRDDAPVVDADATIVMAGHQPTLFHPGVWFKNFTLDRIGVSTNSLAVNLVVDSDVAPPSSIRVPQRHARDGELGYTTVPYDRRGGGVPYEQALIEDRDCFDAFDRNVIDAVKGIVDDPLITPLWRHARDAINRCGFAGCALAQARHRLEADLGRKTLEIPQSVVCRGEAFAKFVMQILRDLPRFHRCYNDSAECYRTAHGIRSSAHPVPNLRREGQWYEAPLWVYGQKSPERRGVWVRRAAGGRQLEISDLDRRTRKIDLPESDSAQDAFLALATPEFKIRSRALVTTMYARMVLSDLFLHGIGGGKYDQLGDLISGAFWGVRPPEFMVVSATVLLPGHQDHPTDRVDASLRQIKRKLRDIEYQPERFAADSGISVESIVAKRALLESIPPKGQRYDWHQQITELNRRMAAELEPRRRQLVSHRDRLAESRRQTTIWNHREHPFCVYPLDYLNAAYEEMLRV